MHGEMTHDSFLLYYNEERDDKQVLDYLESENQYYQWAIDRNGISESIEKFKSEFKRYIPETDVSPPSQEGDYFYFTKTAKSLDYPVYYRFHRDTPEEVQTILDVNDLAKGKPYYQVIDWQVSHNGKWMAYLVDEDGSENPMVWLKNLSEEVEAVETDIQAEEICWHLDNQTLFYTTLDDHWRAHKLWTRDVISINGKSRLLYDEKDPEFRLEIALTQDGFGLLVSSVGAISNEIRILDLRSEIFELDLIIPKSMHVEYDLDIDHESEEIFIRTNASQKNFELRVGSLSKFRDEELKTIRSGNSETKLEGFQLFKNFIILFERHQGQEYLVQIEREQFSSKRFPMDPDFLSIEEGENHLWDSECYRFHTSGYHDCEKVIDWNLRENECSILKEQWLPDHINLSDYCVHRYWVDSNDSMVRIPVTIFSKHELLKQKPHSAVLISYGAYGDSIDPYFRASYLSLLDRGICVIIAHIRGGGFLGEAWREAGRHFEKKNSINDFLDVARWARSDFLDKDGRLGFHVASAGGIPGGAAINIQPDLFSVGILEVPFLDVVTTMSNPDIPLTCLEFLEWGNPEMERDYKLMKSYSPYDNIKDQKIPPILVTAGLNDPRVGFWEPAKYIAKLRTQSQVDQGHLYLKTNMQGGHFGKSGREAQFYEVAEFCAFLEHFLIR